MAKETISKMKKQPTEWEEIFANQMSEKGSISKIHKQLIQLNSKKKHGIQFKNGQRIYIGIVPKKTHKWSTGT